MNRENWNEKSYGILQSSRRLRLKLTECASHTTERTGHVLGGSQNDGLSSI